MMVRITFRPELPAVMIFWQRFKIFMIEESACIVLYHPQHIYQEGRTVDGIAHLQDHRAVPPTKYTVALLLL